MTSDHDPELLRVFADVQRPLEGERFTKHVIEQLQREQRTRDRLRYAAIVIAAVGCAFAAPVLLERASELVQEISVQLRTETGGSESVWQWLPALLLAATAFGFTSVRRLIQR